MCTGAVVARGGVDGRTSGDKVTAGRSANGRLRMRLVAAAAAATGHEQSRPNAIVHNNGRNSKRKKRNEKK